MAWNVSSKNCVAEGESSATQDQNSEGASHKNFNEGKFKEDLKMAPWHVDESFESVDEQCEYWEALLNKIVDDHLPTRDIKVRAQCTIHDERVEKCY